MLILKDVLTQMDRIHHPHPVGGITFLMDGMYLLWIEIPDGQSILETVNSRFSRYHTISRELPVTSIQPKRCLCFHKHGRMMGWELLYTIDLKAHPLPATSSQVQGNSQEIYNGGPYQAPWYR